MDKIRDNYFTKSNDGSKYMISKYASKLSSNRPWRPTVLMTRASQIQRRHLGKTGMEEDRGESSRTSSRRQGATFP